MRERVFQILKNGTFEDLKLGKSLTVRNRDEDSGAGLLIARGEVMKMDLERKQDLVSQDESFVLCLPRKGDLGK